MRHKSLSYSARATYGENNWATCANSLVPKRPLILWASLFNGTLYSETVVCRIRRSSDHTQPAVRKTPECFLCCTERTATWRQIRVEITVIIIMMCLRAEYHTVFLFVGPASSVGGSSHKRLFYCWWTTNCSNPLPPRFRSLSLSLASGAQTEDKYTWSDMHFSNSGSLRPPWDSSVCCLCTTTNLLSC